MVNGDSVRISSEIKEVKLYGTRASVFSAVVENVLKIKGVPYEYLREDLQNKSEDLLRLNPVHKKIPVLVVDGKAIAESLVISEYIDETWNSPKIIPEDPYQRALVRFWADFIYKKVTPCSYTILQSVGDAQKKATEELAENLMALENGIQGDFQNTGKPFINGVNPGLLDIIMGSCSCGIRVLTYITGIEFLEIEKTPVLYSSIHSFENIPMLKETQVPYEELLGLVLARREKSLASTA